MPDIEREVRQLVDGVPPPDDPAPEDDEHDDGHHIQMFAVEPPLLIVFRDGSVNTEGCAGTLLVAWGVLSSAVTGYLALSWLWERATPLGVATAIVSIVFGIGGAAVLLLAMSFIGWLAGRCRAWRGGR